VTILEYLDRMVPLEDEEVSAELAKRYRRLGVDVLTSAQVQSIDESADSVSVTFVRAARPRPVKPKRCCRRSGSRRM